VNTSVEPSGNKSELRGRGIPEVHDQCTDNTLRRADVERLELPALHDRFAIDRGDSGHVQRRGGGLIDERAVRAQYRGRHECGRQRQEGGGEERKQHVEELEVVGVGADVRRYRPHSIFIPDLDQTGFGNNGSESQSLSLEYLSRC
jgi:hypothetical protein